MLEHVQQFGRLEQFPGLLEQLPGQLPGQKPQLTHDELMQLKQEGICWSPSVRNDERVMAVELFGIPAFQMVAYLSKIVHYHGLTLLGWYESKRDFQGRINVTVETGANSPTQKSEKEYPKKQIIIFIPVNQYFLVPEDEMLIPTEFGTPEQVAQCPFNTTLHPTVPISALVKALKNRKPHTAEEEYIANIPPFLPPSTVKATLAHAIRTKYAQFLKEQGSNLGAIWKKASQIEVWGKRSENDADNKNSTLYFIAGATKAALDMARKIISDGLNAFGMPIYLGDNAATRAVEKANYAEHDTYTADKKCYLYIERNGLNPAMLTHAIEYNIQQSGAVASITTARVARSSKRWGYSRTAFVTFTTKTMKDKFQAWAEMRQSEFGDLSKDLGLQFQCKIKTIKVDHDWEEEDRTATTEILLEPQDALYHTKDDVSVCSIDDIMRQKLHIDETDTLSDLSGGSDDETGGAAAAEPAAAAAAAATNTPATVAGKKRSGRKPRAKAAGGPATEAATSETDAAMEGPATLGKRHAPTQQAPPPSPPRLSWMDALIMPAATGNADPNRAVNFAPAAS